MLIVYFNENGEPIADAKAKKYVASEIAEYYANKKNEREISVSNAIVVTEFCLAVKHKALESDDIIFKYNDINNEALQHFLHVNQTGEIQYWPSGFCDHYSIACLELLGEK